MKYFLKDAYMYYYILVKVIKYSSQLHHPAKEKQIILFFIKTVTFLNVWGVLSLSFILFSFFAKF